MIKRAQQLIARVPSLPDDFLKDALLTFLECGVVLIVAYSPFLFIYLQFLISTQDAHWDWHTAAKYVFENVTITELVFHLCTILGAGFYHCSASLIKPISSRVTPLILLIASFLLLLISFVTHFGTSPETSFNQPFTKNLTYFLYVTGLIIWWITVFHNRRLNSQGPVTTNKAKEIMDAIVTENKNG